jgi:hypothetical protein
VPHREEQPVHDEPDQGEQDGYDPSQHVSVCSGVQKGKPLPLGVNEVLRNVCFCNHRPPHGARTQPKPKHLINLPPLQTISQKIRQSNQQDSVFIWTKVETVHFRHNLPPLSKNRICKTVFTATLLKRSGTLVTLYRIFHNQCVDLL